MVQRKCSQTKYSRGCHLFRILADLASRVYMFLPDAYGIYVICLADEIFMLFIYTEHSVVLQTFIFTKSVRGHGQDTILDQKLLPMTWTLFKKMANVLHNPRLFSGRQWASSGKIIWCSFKYFDNNFSLLCYSY